MGQGITCGLAVRMAEHVLQLLVLLAQLLLAPLELLDHAGQARLALAAPRVLCLLRACA
jgi:hypothetical protein